MATKQFGLLCYAVEPAAEAPRNVLADGQAPSLPEIHLNIWECDDLPAKDAEAFLDIGLMFDLNETAATIELIFPWKVEKDTIVDLSTFIATSVAIPTIFNESWALSAQDSDYVVYDPRNPDSGFALVSIDGVLTEKSYPIASGNGNTTSHVYAISIDISKLKQCANRAAGATNHTIQKFYTRFRIPNIQKDFYRVGASSSGMDLSTMLRQKTEDIDFRLNVRRGAPPSLEKAIGKFVEFSKVHLFLMRSRDKDIVFQDKLFRASRSDFWARYSLKDANNTHPSESVIAKNRERVKKSLGYQWKSGGNGQPVKEFGTLARFRIVKIAVWQFVGWALLLSVAGNITLDVIKWSLTRWGLIGTQAGVIEAICVNPGDEFRFPKQECAPSTRVESLKDGGNRQIPKKD